jgi:hypothetical protein
MTNRSYCEAQNINYGEQCSHRATYTYIGGVTEGQYHCTRHANKRSRYAVRLDEHSEADIEALRDKARRDREYIVQSPSLSPYAMPSP